MSSDFESNSYLYGANETYLAQMYARYLEDPSSVDPEWSEVFRDLADDGKNVKYKAFKSTFRLPLDKLRQPADPLQAVRAALPIIGDDVDYTPLGEAGTLCIAAAEYGHVVVVEVLLGVHISIAYEI